MSLYGALFGGVSGLQGQSQKIGMISDNIANVNTVGYKESEALFETLVVNSTTAVAYQTGGVRANTRMNVDKQGLLLTTDSSTDIALSGSGFFSVNAQVDGSGEPLYTRAGSFRQDAAGNFVNAAGFYLQGWPLDENGLRPGEIGNRNTVSFAVLDSLETVNIETASGTAIATTEVTFQANLDAAEEIYPGEAGTVTMDELSALNFEISADEILVPDEYGLAGTNSIYRGDQFRVSTGNGLQYDYTYGGFAIGRDVSTSLAAGNGGDLLADVTGTYNLAGGEITAVGGAGSTTFNVNLANHGLLDNDEISLSAVAANIGATPAAEFNGSFTVSRIDANNFQFTITGGTPHGGAGANADGVLDIRQFTGNIFDASTVSQAFFGELGTTDINPAALQFTIETNTSGLSTFRYTTSSPNPTVGEFNSLLTLSAAINEVNGLTSRVTNGRLFVSAENPNEAVTFANGDATGTGSLRGIDWVSELDLQNVTQSTRRFNTLQSLANLVNGDEGVSAVVANPQSEAELQIRVDDPLDTIQFDDVGIDAFPMPTAANSVTVPATAAGADIDVVVTDAGFPTTLNVGDYIVIQNAGGLVGTGGLPGNFPNSLPTRAFEVVSVNAGADYTFRIPGAFNTAGTAGGSAAGAGTETISILGESNQGSLLAEFGLVDSLNSNIYTAQSTGTLGPRYDSSGVVGDNIASGDLVPQYSRPIQVFDAQGTRHDLSLGFIKIDTNEWAVEVYAADDTEVSSLLPNGQVAVGNIRFNGDGSLRSISSQLSDPIEINWTNGAAPSEITIDWGTAGSPLGTEGALVFGDTTGLSQFDADYEADVDQNGAGVGELVNVTITEEGIVQASFDNGETQALYQLPVVMFSNPNGLRSLSGNVYAETNQSGDFNLREVGENGAGDIVSGSLEQSNVDLGEQLTDLIVAQRSYQANTRVVSTSDELLEQLTQI
ncbi:MAG: hypothetical protein CMM94_01890 [Rickettsiales bacterium]|nr:hypothetical protein [Rickettsiales bacterium]